MHLIFLKMQMKLAYTTKAAFVKTGFRKSLTQTIDSINNTIILFFYSFIVFIDL